ncbi:MAG: anti-sigma factor [Pseudomonadota bacterium]
MTDTTFAPQEDDDALAAEYVLGVLSLSDRVAAETRAKRDDAFAAMIAAWETRLSGLNDDYDEAPAPNLLPAIEARLFPVAPAAAKPGFGWMRLLGGIGLAAALALAVYLVQPVPGPVQVATLTSADAGLVYEARFVDEQMIVTRVAGSPAPAGEVHELWIIAPDAPPVSLGLLADATLSVPYPAPPAGWVLAVSVEPAGGSPAAGPTGPVILTAEIPPASET